MAQTATDSLSILTQPLAWPLLHRRKTWLAVVLAIVAMYVLGISPHWWIGKDAGLYLNLARNLAEGRGYTLAGVPNVNVPPGFPFLLAGMMRIGAGSFLAINIVIALTGLATVLASYLLLRELVHPDWAMLMAIVVALSNEILPRSGEVLSDMPFALLLMAGFWLYYRGLRRGAPDRRFWEIGSLLLVASCWFRVAGFPIAAGGAVGLVIAGWRSGPKRALLNLGLMIIGLGLTFGFFLHAFKAGATATSASYASMLEAHAGEPFFQRWILGTMERFGDASEKLSRLYVAQRLPMVLALLLTVAPVAAAMVRRLLRRDASGPLAVTIFVGGLCLISGLQTRYLMPLAPLLVLYLVEGYEMILVRLAPLLRAAGGTLAPEKRAKAIQSVSLALMGTLLAFNLPLVGRNIYEKHRPDYAVNQQRGHWKDEYLAAQYLKGHPSRDGCILAEQPVGYLAGLQCPILSHPIMESTPSEAQVEALLKELGVRYVAFELKDEVNDNAGKTKVKPFVKAMMNYLAQSGPPVFTSGNLRVYGVPQAGTSATRPAGS